MSFSYTPGTPVFYVRSLIPDTNSTRSIFSDEEINGFLYLNSSQFLYVSAMAVQGGAAPIPPVQVYSFYRTAAMAIDVIASDRAKLATLQQVLDIKIDGGKAQASLHEIAESLRTQEDNLGHFAIAEMTFDPFAARERTLNQLLRIQGN